MSYNIAGIRFTERQIGGLILIAIVFFAFGGTTVFSYFYYPNKFLKPPWVPNDMWSDLVFAWQNALQNNGVAPAAPTPDFSTAAPPQQVGSFVQNVNQVADQVNANPQDSGAAFQNFAASPAPTGEQTGDSSQSFVTQVTVTADSGGSGGGDGGGGSSIILPVFSIWNNAFYAGSGSYSSAPVVGTTSFSYTAPSASTPSSAYLSYAMPPPTAYVNYAAQGYGPNNPPPGMTPYNVGSAGCGSSGCVSTGIPPASSALKQGQIYVFNSQTNTWQAQNFNDASKLASQQAGKLGTAGFTWSYGSTNPQAIFFSNLTPQTAPPGSPVTTLPTITQFDKIFPSKPTGISDAAFAEARQVAATGGSQQLSAKTQTEFNTYFSKLPNNGIPPGAHPLQATRLPSNTRGIQVQASRTVAQQILQKWAQRDYRAAASAFLQGLSQGKVTFNNQALIPPSTPPPTPQIIQTLTLLGPLGFLNLKRT